MSVASSGLIGIEKCPVSQAQSLEGVIVSWATHSHMTCSSSQFPALQYPGTFDSLHGVRPTLDNGAASLESWERLNARLLQTSCLVTCSSKESCGCGPALVCWPHSTHLLWFWPVL